MWVPRVVLVALDGFPAGAVTPETAPNLAALGREGGMNPQGGRTALPSSTDPGFCTLLTGCLPRRHGVRTTAWRFGWAPAWLGEPAVRVPTIFEVCAAGGLASAAIVADDHGLVATGGAARRWPPDGPLDPGMPRDLYGYPSNEAVRPHWLRAAADPSFSLVFLHCNESDTAGHEFGPTSAAAAAAYRACDQLVGDLLEVLRPDWSNTVVIVVSDHDMEPWTDAPWIDLMAAASVRELADDVVPDGGCALLHLRPGFEVEHAAEAVRGLSGVAAVEDAGDRIVVVAAHPGRSFSAAHHPGGFHGGPATARTVAVVGGGHPETATLSEAVRRHRPHLADWAPTITAMLGLGMPDADGHDLRQTTAIVSR